jgi:spore germination protein YaaH
MISEGGATLQWDDTAKTPWFTYRDKNGVTRTCWFENKDSLAAKLEVGTKYNVGGICIWSLGSEDPASWDVIKSFTER